MRFNSKNFKCIRKDGVQKIKKGAARFSATSANIKINTIMSTFFRIRAGSSFDFLCQCDSLMFIYEVNGLKTGLNLHCIKLQHIDLRLKDCGKK